MSGLGASADCPAPIIAGSAVSICEPLINGSPVSVIYSVARCGTTNYSLNDTVLRLTAIPNWTGRPTVTGAPLAGLAALWVAGRVVMLTGAGLPWPVVPAVDVAFLPLAAVAMLPPLVASRNRRNIAFPFVLIALSLVNLTLHLDAAGVVALGAEAT